MIHNMKLTPFDLIGNPDGTNLTFTVITPVGKCDCKVILSDLDKDGRAAVYVTEYEIPGQRIENIDIAKAALLRDNTMPQYETINKLYSEGLRRIVAELQDICDNNRWCLFSY